MSNITISVVIPVFNEVATVHELVDNVLAVPIPKELIIVDDFSTDGTRDILRELGDHPDVRIILSERNRGKGAALRRGFAVARGEIVIVQDADLEYDPRDYPRLIAPIVEGKADVVYGSRFISGEVRRVLYYWHFIGNRILTALSNAFTNLNLTDMETCYKVFRREIIQGMVIEEDRFGFEPEVTAKIAGIRGCRIYEVGISYHGRTYEEGKKIGWRDGVRAVWCILKYRRGTQSPAAAERRRGDRAEPRLSGMENANVEPVVTQYPLLDAPRQSMREARE
jgi:glycosyltransferase involved in cell wall biosynthesis